MTDRERLIYEITMEVQAFVLQTQPAAIAVATILHPDDEPIWFFNGTVGENGATPDGKTIWQIGSITKTFTSSLLAAAACEQKLTLESLIQTYAPQGVRLPTYNTPTQKIGLNFVELATHTSGLPLDPLNVSGLTGYRTEQMFAYLDSYSISVLPGTNWNYSNLAYGLLAHLVQDIMQFPDYQDAVDWLKAACRLEMPDTVIHLNSAQAKRFSPGFSAPGKSAPVQTVTWPALNGSGALYSTLNDMLVWLRTTMDRSNRRFAPFAGLTQQVYFSISSSQQLFLQNGTDAMGLGWERDDLKTRNRQACWGKGGATNGFTSFIGFLPTDRSGIVILCNSAWVWPQDLGIRVLSLISRNSKCG